MKLKEVLIKEAKEDVYDLYCSIVYDVEDYDDITRGKMLDLIIKEYQQKEYLYHICTTKELDFLKDFLSNSLKPSDLKKYDWEIKQLNSKGIFSMDYSCIYEEQLPNVQDAIRIYSSEKKIKQNEDQMILFLIGFIKTNVDMNIIALSTLISSMAKIDKEHINSFLAHPLIHFYCGFYENNTFLKGTKFIYYRAYEHLLDDLFEARKEYGIAGSRNIDITSFLDMFYYGYPLQNKKVKKMYDTVSQLKGSGLYFEMITRARILNDRRDLSLFIEDDKLLQIIEDALDEMPCAAMNGFTPKEYQKEKNKDNTITQKFDLIPQNNAHLSKNAANTFYKLYFALLEYTNNQYHINKNIKKIYKQEEINPNELIEINQYLWDHKEVLDEFVSENPYHFDEEELSIINQFKSAVTGMFVIVGFEREYTKFLHEDGKIFMVKGVRCDIDQIIDSDSIPIVVETTLLMFKDKIVYNSFFAQVDISLGADFKEQVLLDMNKAMTYYHL